MHLGAINGQPGNDIIVFTVFLLALLPLLTTVLLNRNFKKNSLVYHLADQTAPLTRFL